MANLKDLTIDDAGFIRLPAGTSGERPSSPQNGMMRYNTDINKFEHYTGSGWEEVLLSQSSSLPSGNISGSVLQQSVPAGTVLQTKFFNTTSSVGTTSTSFQDLIDVDITPSSSSSKILIIASMHAYYGHGNASFGWHAVNLRILRNGSSIYSGGGSGGYTLGSRHNGSAWRKMGQVETIYLDSPNTTSNITYTIQGNRRSSGGSASVTWSQYGTSEVTLMEIAG